MKRIVSAVLSAVMLFSLCVGVFADQCAHEYTAQHFEANCREAEHTVYTCVSCGASYTKYAYEYDDPGTFSFVFETERNDTEGTLTLNATLVNNPGLSIGIMEVGYNSETLRPVSFANGVVWNRDEINMGKEVNLERHPLRIYAERTSEEINYANGLYFTIVFSIIDPVGDYGFEYTLRKADFANVANGQSFLPGVIDLTGKRETGDHVLSETVISPTCTESGYTLQSCTLCDFSEKVLETEPLGHEPGEITVVKAPTFTEEGYGISTCLRCSAEIDTVIPVLERWRKGDLNNDGKVNISDSHIMKTLITGKLASSSEQMTDAADVNGDGKINASDMNLLKKILVGG